MAKGTEFEEKALEYLKFLFEELRFRVTEARQQDSGTQNGFDLIIGFIDDNGKARKFYFECKDYESKISWNDIKVKIHELHSSNHRPDGFIAVSPKVNFSNINLNNIESLKNLVHAPIRYWTPETNVQEYFSFDSSFFEYIYKRKPRTGEYDPVAIKQKLHAIIIDMLRQKDEMAIRPSSDPIQKELTNQLQKRNPEDIVGRTKDLEKLNELLFSNKQVVVVNGMGGIGKTTLAQAYISKYYDSYRHIAWITQLTTDFISDLTGAEGLLENLSIDRTGKGIQQLFQEIIRKLKAIPGSPNLIILDNVSDDLVKLEDYLPGQPDWHVLATSRKKIDGFFPLDLDFLSLDEGVALFKKYCKRNISDEEITEVVETIDKHTLTIEILARTAEYHRTDIQSLKKAIQDDIESHVYIKHKGGRIDKVRSYLSSIFNFSGLNKDEKWLMKQFACLPTEYHAYDRLLEVINPNAGKRNVFAELCNRLVEQGWLLNNKETDSYKMHLIVQEVAKRQLSVSLKDIDRLLNKVIELLGMDYTKDNPVEKFKWIPFGNPILSHFDDDTSDVISHLQNNLALWLKEQGHYKQASDLLQKAMLSVEKNFGPDHPKTAREYYNLGLVLRDLGQYEQARDLLQKAVLSDEKNFGPDSSETAMSYSSLSTVLRNLGLYEEARDLMQKAVQSDESNFGSDHPKTAVSYSNMAQVLQDLGQYEQAWDLMQKAVLSAEKNFGPDHPTTAMRYSNLATVLQELEQYEEARDLMQKAIQSDESNFGSDHPKMAVSYSNLALVLQDLGQYEQARDLLQKAVVSAEKNLGPDNPTTAIRYSNLATVLEDLGKYEVALELAEKGLSIFKKNLPIGHPHIAKAQAIYDSIKNHLT